MFISKNQIIFLNQIQLNCEFVNLIAMSTAEIETCAENVHRWECQ